MNDMKAIRFPPPVADEMVRAILEGRKTVIRQVVKPQPLSKLAYVCMGYKHGTWDYPDRDEWKYWGDESFRLPDNFPDSEKDRRWTPPCHTGDILYVREKWCSACDGEKYFYFADKCTPKEECKMLDYDNVCWRPSIHMPHEAARLFLRVTDVRVERLQDMTDDDFVCDFGVCREAIQAVGRDALAIPFWDSTIKKPADRALYGWEANPWVWVIAFERCEKPEKVL